MFLLSAAGWPVAANDLLSHQSKSRFRPLYSVRKRLKTSYCPLTFNLISIQTRLRIRKKPQAETGLLSLIFDMKWNLANVLRSYFNVAIFFHPVSFGWLPNPAGMGAKRRAFGEAQPSSTPRLPRWCCEAAVCVPWRPIHRVPRGERGIEGIE